MGDLINKWIKETITEFEEAKKDQNYYKMIEMKYLLQELRILRDKLVTLKPDR